MNDLRRYINILETASKDELQKYRDEQKYWQNELKKYLSVSPELMAQYNDGSHTTKDSLGNLAWYQNRELHRARDKPAYIGVNGTLEWYKNGLVHRDGDKPAYINSDGDLGWYQNDRCHRDGDKPAYINSDGDLEWCQNGLRHRDGDKPAVIKADGRLYWCQNNQLHRFGGPAAIDSNGSQAWYWRGEEIPVESQEEFIEYMKKYKGLQRFRVNKS